MSPSRDIILYHYTYSPFGRRVVWYLRLRKIPYIQCIQPPTMPRPDVKAIGVEYRRIPLMAIGRDIYHDSRLIISKLEQLFPPSAEHPSISPSNPDQVAIARLLDIWSIDGGLFTRSSQLLPTSLPLMKDEEFTKDREQYTGRSWSHEGVERARPEALTEMKYAFGLLEETFFKDGRQWVLKTESPTLADINGIWPFHWLTTIKDALPPDQISAQQYPNVYAWIARFQNMILEAGEAIAKPKVVKGPEAAARIGSSEYAEEDVGVSPSDSSGLEKGQDVEVWPTDTGFNNRDRGVLVGLTVEQSVIECRTEEGKVVRVHAPRHGFRMRKVGTGKGAKI